MSARARRLTRLGLILVILLSQTSMAADSTGKSQVVVVQNTQQDAQVVAGEQQAKHDALVILGLVESLHLAVRNATENQLGDLNVIYADLNEIQDSSYQWPVVDRVIATGVAGCEIAIDVQLQVPVVCVFLTAEKFQSIVEKQPIQVQANLTAIVIDQPVVRQAAVAKKVYPALSRFAVLSQSIVTKSQIENDDISVSAYRAGKALAPQLSEVTIPLDALIATPETAIYNRSTLRTVLLTAYGYGKPVVGYSRAYVKAGALITAYSTPDQVFRHIAEMPDIDMGGSLAEADTKELAIIGFKNVHVLSPKYFSIVDNPSVAKSLGLTKLFDFVEGKSYADKDFRS